MRIIFIFLSLIISLNWGSLCLAADSGLLHYKLNDKIPSFKLKVVNRDKTFTFSPTNGKPSVLIFFSITPNFRAKRSVNLAEIIAKLDKNFGKRVNFINIYSGGKLNKLKKFVQDGLINIPILNDSDKEVYKKYGVFMLPIAIISDSKGKLQSVIPYTANISEILNNNLKFLLGELSLKQFKNAIASPKNIIKTKKEKAYIRRVNYGRVMVARKMYSAALREFNTARKIMPNSIEALIGLGDVQLELKQWQEAEHSFKKALRINKDSDKALAGLGLTLYKSGEIIRAKPILENALISADQDLEVVVSLAAIYEKNGNIIKAIRLNKLAISILQKQFN